MGMFGGDTVFANVAFKDKSLQIILIPYFKKFIWKWAVFAQEKLAKRSAGKKASAGRDDKEKHEVNSNENVWSKGQESSKNVGETKEETIRVSRKEKQKYMQIEGEIKRLENVSQNENLSEQINFKMTDEGLRIDITDNKGRQMFSSGSDRPSKTMKKILSVVGAVLTELKNDIAITGHTDSKPFTKRRNYSNWELSSDRAHASRRALIEMGVEAKRMKRIEGRSDRDPLEGENPDAHINRRIGIIILRDTSFEAMKKAHQAGENL